MTRDSSDGVSSPTWDFSDDAMLIAFVLAMSFSAVTMALTMGFGVEAAVAYMPMAGLALVIGGMILENVAVGIKGWIA